MVDNAKKSLTLSAFLFVEVLQASGNKPDPTLFRWGDRYCLGPGGASWSQPDLLNFILFELEKVLGLNYQAYCV